MPCEVAVVIHSGEDGVDTVSVGGIDAEFAELVPEEAYGGFDIGIFRPQGGVVAEGVHEAHAGRCAFGGMELLEPFVNLRTEFSPFGGNVEHHPDEEAPCGFMSVEQSIEEGHKRVINS